MFSLVLIQFFFVDLKRENMEEKAGLYVVFRNDLQNKSFWSINRCIHESSMKENKFFNSSSTSSEISNRLIFFY